MKLANYKPKINSRNQFFAEKIRQLANNYSIIGVVDVSSLPAPQFQRIRASLKKEAEVLIVKRNIIELVLDELDKKSPGIKELTSKLSGVVGLVFTNSNPFSLYKVVKKNKSTAPAKAGQTAPNDIVVPAGPTNFAPGPVIGELGALKIKAGINAGKVEIKEDAIVAKEGEVISSNLAGILTRLGIEPMEVGLNIKAVFEEGVIFSKSVLDVDEDEILNNLKQASMDSFALSIGLDYYTKENIQLFVENGSRDALGLALGIEYVSDVTLSPLVSKAYNQLVALSSKLPSELVPEGLTQNSATNNVVASETSVVNEEKTEEKEPEVNLSDLF